MDPSHLDNLLHLQAFQQHPVLGVQNSILRLQHAAGCPHQQRLGALQPHLVLVVLGIAFDGGLLHALDAGLGLVQL